MLLKDTRTLDLEICAEFLESLQKDKRLEKVRAAPRVARLILHSYHQNEFQELIENQIRTIEADLKRTRSMVRAGPRFFVLDCC